MIGKPTSQRIEYLSVIGRFLDGLRITFRGGLNCVIGARGTGKTTAVEFVGYALDALPHREHAADERKRIENLVKRNLNGGRIELGIRATDGTAYRVTRSFGDEPIVLDESGAPAAVNLKSGLFRAEIFSQNAVESIADRPLFQLDLIDSFAGSQIAEIFSSEQHLVSTLKANAHQIIPLERDVAAIQDEMAALPGIETKLKAYGDSPDGANAEINEAHRLKSVRDRESRSLQRLRELLVQFQETVRSQIGGIDSRTGNLFDAETLKGPNGAILQEAFQEVKACSKDVDSLLDQAARRIEAVGQTITGQVNLITQKHREQELAFRSTIEKHKQAQQQAAERSELERRRNQLLARQQQQSETSQRITELYARRRDLLEQKRSP